MCPRTALEASAGDIALRQKTRITFEDAQVSICVTARQRDSVLWPAQGRAVIISDFDRDFLCNIIPNHICAEKRNVEYSIVISFCLVVVIRPNRHVPETRPILTREFRHTVIDNYHLARHIEH